MGDPPGGNGQACSGSALLLMPAAVLIVVILGSLAVDSAIVFAAQRQLADAASSAANDAVTAGLADAPFYACGQLDLDPQRVRSVVVESLAARSADIVEAVETVTVGRGPNGEPTVAVAVRGSVTPLLAPALPGTERSRTVQAHAEASAARRAAPQMVQAGCGAAERD